MFVLLRLRLCCVVPFKSVSSCWHSGTLTACVSGCEAKTADRGTVDAISVSQQSGSVCFALFFFVFLHHFLEDCLMNRFP